MTELTLAFHKSIYLPDAVKATAETYQPYAESVDVEDAEIETLVTLKGFDARYGDTLGDEFANYALFQTIVRSRETLGGVPV